MVGKRKNKTVTKGGVKPKSIMFLKWNNDDWKVVGDPKSGASTNSATDAKQFTDGNKQKTKKLGLVKTWETGGDGPIAEYWVSFFRHWVEMVALDIRLRRVEAWIESQGCGKKTFKQDSKLVSRKGVSRRGNRV